MRVSLWPAQLQHVAIGFTSAASHALATAPASVHAHPDTTLGAGEQTFDGALWATTLPRFEFVQRVERIICAA
jgi:hypothetical protein